ncbi:amid-like NADH oxidoreductase [Aspergillus steynii IBT 23096]|uniref:Amid-like NADH oxidoreductase n=1 Tax=Aspergillus steynii IBT 23096 TaxID=1392250 RepID=A0A2I2FXI8_9EURO|nr:amid-like NADH oxidoreductase [Aspergillus steynii IBT 23096]PLB45322.1 amid-like NADH oxidoreductase [Aspergillus steynii IBT 23096]
MASILRNIIVVGGSYVGKTTAQELARVAPETHRVLLIEPHSHFHHLFTFPRFAVVSGQEHKAFIPYTGLFARSSPTRHVVIQARAISVEPERILLDREWQGSRHINFDYLVVATGTRLAQPAGMKHDDKLSSVAYLQKHQADVQRSRSILIVGGGAVGVQMATDLKECYPDKEVTVVQSRAQLMPGFHEQLHALVKERFDELGVRFVTGLRVVVPEGGFQNDGHSFEVQLTDGSRISTEFVILATGQTPNNSLIRGLAPSATESLINPLNGFIHIRPTMQFRDPQYSKLFAVGDIADTGLRKAARPGSAQAAVVAKNIQAMIEGRNPEEAFPRMPAAIHLTLGMKYNAIFRNPNEAEGQTEPTIFKKDDGQEDMNVEGFWQRLGVEINNANQYHL